MRELVRLSGLLEAHSAAVVSNAKTPPHVELLAIFRSLVPLVDLR